MPWIVFFQNVDAIIGHDEPVIYPESTYAGTRLRTRTRRGPEKGRQTLRRRKQAKDYIGGYVIFNDITARDIQRREMKSGVFSFCKGIDTFLPAWARGS